MQLIRLVQVGVSRTRSTHQNRSTHRHPNRKPIDLSTTAVGDGFVQQNQTLVSLSFGFTSLNPPEPTQLKNR